ncbi:hypothetical protein T12_747 [Trichinella patagoniensis]|uniref:Uncharacterized protein n=1 Tax=Trichinella patagoniensis TaxID=990121 RepID=A0A0V0ZQ85_9BILA|nr:hypothetical protein T12_747 [Trichinella patagoniensis]
MSHSCSASLWLRSLGVCGDSRFSHIPSSLILPSPKSINAFLGRRKSVPSRQGCDRFLATIIECLARNLSPNLMSSSAVPTVSRHSPFAATICLLPCLLILTLPAMLTSDSRITLTAAPVSTKNLTLRPFTFPASSAAHLCSYPIGCSIRRTPWCFRVRQRAGPTIMAAPSAVPAGCIRQLFGGRICHAAPQPH